MFLIPINGYIHVVPFIVDEENNLVLKAVFPSRKFHMKHGAKKA